MVKSPGKHPRKKLGIADLRMHKAWGERTEDGQQRSEKVGLVALNASSTGKSVQIVEHIKVVNRILISDL